MRHRHQIGLYDELQIDSEILDHVAEMPARSRSQAIERFIRIGYMVFIKQMQVQSSVEEACIPTPKGMPLRMPRTNGHEQLAGAAQAPAAVTPSAHPQTTAAPSPQPTIAEAPNPPPTPPPTGEMRPETEQVFSASDPSISQIESTDPEHDFDDEWSDLDLDPLARMAAKNSA